MYCDMFFHDIFLLEHTSGRVAGVFVGHDCDVYILVPLRLVCAKVDLKESFQFLVGLIYHAFGLCVIDG